MTILLDNPGGDQLTGQQSIPNGAVGLADFIFQLPREMAQ
jgi:hypothetical protein